MRKLSHINIGYTTGLSLIIYNPVLFNVLFVLIPFLSILSDADHGRDSLSSKGLTLPGKHRGWTHSIFGVNLLSAIILFLLGKTLLGLNFETDLNLYLAFNAGILLTTYLLAFIEFLIKKVPLIGSIYKHTYNIYGILYLIVLIGGSFAEIKYGLDLNNNLLLYGGIISIFTGSHLIGDYFTISGIKLAYPFGENVRFPMKALVAVTGNNSEKIYGFIFLFINILLLYYIFSSKDILNALSNVNVKGSIYLILVSAAIIFYFFYQDLKYYNKNGFKTVKQVILNSLMLLVGLLLGGASVFLLLKYNDSGIEYIIGGILLSIVSLIILYKSTKTFFKLYDQILGTFLFFINVLLMIFFVYNSF